MEKSSAVCIGSGRFLRAVLVPILQRVGANVWIFQTRGTSFADAAQSTRQYEVDTIHPDGQVETKTIQVEGVGSLGRESDRDSFFKLPEKLSTLRYIGLGVTDAGVSPNSSAMRELAQFLHKCFVSIPDNTISIINTDNVPSNGDAIKRFVLDVQWPDRPTGSARDAFVDYLNTRVHFHNTMVDRLTSHRPDNTLVPLCEPWTSKIVVIQDDAKVLDANAFTSIPGVFIRASKDEILQDQMLKLRINNATNSALVYILAFSRFRTINEVRLLPAMLAFRDALFKQDILPSVEAEGVPRELALQVYEDWTTRISHPHFGLVNLWVTQQGWMHFNARLFSTIRSNVARDPQYRASKWMAMAAASVLRFLTPKSISRVLADGQVVYQGKMDPVTSSTPNYPELQGITWVYGGDLVANLTTGEYEFQDLPMYPIASRLLQASSEKEVAEAIADAMQLLDGFTLQSPAMAAFVDETVAMYQRLVEHPALDVVMELAAAENRD